MKIYTHVCVDLDAVASVWAAQKFLLPVPPDKEVRFVPANWDGAGMEDDDIAIDIEAGGKGFKGVCGYDDTVHACFPEMMRIFACDANRRAMQSLMDFVEAQDTTGNAIKALAPGLNPNVQEVLYATNITAVMNALRAVHPNDDATLTRMMGQIFDGMLLAGLAKGRAQEEVSKAITTSRGLAAVVKDAKEFATNGVLFNSGVRVIIYVDGNNLGLTRAQGETLRMDHPKIREVVEAAGEADEWFAHPAGFLFCRGSRKAPAETPSKVDPLALQSAIESLLP